jgi:alpha-aminoadipic semialdehyde synthase
MAIDYLPCELPADATQSFGDALVDFVPSLVRTDFRQPFQALDLPAELRRALIVQDGQLTPDYVHLRQFLGALP